VQDSHILSSASLKLRLFTNTIFTCKKNSLVNHTTTKYFRSYSATWAAYWTFSHGEWSNTSCLYNEINEEKHARVCGFVSRSGLLCEPICVSLRLLQRVTNIFVFQQPEVEAESGSGSDSGSSSDSSSSSSSSGSDSSVESEPTVRPVPVAVTPKVRGNLSSSVFSYDHLYSQTIWKQVI
jgi:uncharacterized membrane protein YgcG